MPPRSADKPPMQRLHELLMQRVGVGVQLLHRLSDLKWRRLWRHRFPETYRYRIGNLARQLPQEASFFEAEDRAPNAVKMHRHDGRGALRRDPFHDALHAAAKRK